MMVKSRNNETTMVKVETTMVKSRNFKVKISSFTIVVSLFRLFTIVVSLFRNLDLLNKLNTPRWPLWDTVKYEGHMGFLGDLLVCYSVGLLVRPAKVQVSSQGSFL